jgi:hypothetical protein
MAGRPVGRLRTLRDYSDRVMKLIDDIAADFPESADDDTDDDTDEGEGTVAGYLHDAVHHLWMAHGSIDDAGGVVLDAAVAANPERRDEFLVAHWGETAYAAAVEASKKAAEGLPLAGG